MVPEASVLAAPSLSPTAPNSSPLRKAALAAWWVLLGGYLIFNRPFATLGVSPVYVGEVVLALGLLANITRLEKIFVEPLRRSWTFRFIALFWLYGVVRALMSFPEHRFWALRDSVIATYAFVAFLAPWLWAEYRASPASPDPQSRAAHANGMMIHITDMLLPISIAALLFAASIHYGWMSTVVAANIKVDFLAIGTAVAGWMGFVAAARRVPGSDQKENSITLRFAGAALLAIGGIFLLTRLPVRALWPSIGLLTLAALCALATNTVRRGLLGGALFIVFLFINPSLIKAAQVFKRVNTEFALDKDLAKLPSPPPTPTPPVAATTSPATPEIKPPEPAPQKTFSNERLDSILDADPNRFKSLEGQVAAHNIRWRAAFWMRCIHYTRHNAPLTGIGFGENLTLLLRRTPAWPLFVQSQQTDPPNRSPHCAHLTIFTRLGLVGVFLWSSILIGIMYRSIEALWLCRKSDAAIADSQRKVFWPALGVFGVWLIFLCAMTFGVVLENPMGGIWFWALTGVLAWWSGTVRAVPREHF